MSKELLALCQRTKPFTTVDMHGRSNNMDGLRLSRGNSRLQKPVHDGDGDVQAPCHTIGNDTFGASRHDVIAAFNPRTTEDLESFPTMY